MREHDATAPSGLLLAGLVFGASAAIVEGAWITASAPDVPAWSVWLTPGALAPPLAIMLLLLLALRAAWRLIPGRPAPGATVRRVIRGAAQGPPQQLAWRGAMTAATLALVVTWLMIAVELGERVQQQVQTPTSASLLSALLLAGVAFTLALGSPLLIGPLGWLFARVAARSPGAALLVSPVGILAGASLLGGLGLIAIWPLYGDLFRVLPWGYVLAPLVGGLCSVGALRGLRHRARTRRVVSAALTVAFLSSGALVFYLPEGWREARSLFFDQPSYSSAWIEWLDAKLDHDGDGLSAYFGGGDCAPDNPRIAPNQFDILDNGVDEDCTGSDLSLDLSAYRMGERVHPRPDGVIERPNIVLITTDSLSFSHTTLGGYSRDTTPNLARWAARATVFESAFSIGPSTRMVWPTIAAGLINSQIPLIDGRRDPFGWQDTVQTLATRLKGAGYHTVHIQGGSVFSDRRWVYTYGFDEVEAPWRRAADPAHPAPEVTQAAIQQVEKPRSAPLFLWVHYYDHHAPFDAIAGEVSFGDDEVDRFDAEVRFTDAAWTRLFEAIEARWQPEEHLTIFTADHGESFDANHPTHHHGQSLRTAELHVPMIIQASGGRGRRVDGLVSHLDIAPTLMNIVGQPADPAWQGESLTPVLFDGAAVGKTVLFSLIYAPEYAKRGEDPFREIGARDGRHYFFMNLRKNNPRLVDWRADPLERRDLTERLETEASALRYLALERLMWLRENEAGLPGSARDRGAR